MDIFVEESDLNYTSILKSGANCCGDEDFDIFSCPKCKSIYLICYECDTIYINGKDLNKKYDSRKHNKGRMVCSNCSFKFGRNDILIGSKASEWFRVSFDQLLNSDWAWVLEPHNKSSKKDALKRTSS